MDSQDKIMATTSMPRYETFNPTPNIKGVL